MPREREEYPVVWPQSERKSELRPLAPRLETLAGTKVAELWDFLFRGDQVFEELQTGLRERYPDIEFVSWREFGNTHGEDEARVLAELPARLRSLGVDAVISGMGC